MYFFSPSGKFFIKEWVTGHLYAASTSIATNDYAGQFGKIAYIFTKEGFRNFLISLSGKILYLGVASFGLAYWGIKHIVKQIYKAFTDFKNGKEIETKSKHKIKCICVKDFLIG